MRLDALDHVALFVRDVPRAAAWYRDVLGLERQFEDAWGDVPTVMGTASGGVALFPARAPADAPEATPRAPRTFARSIYLRDPDGHEVELTTYEV